jgi:hypothetical protein
VSELGTLEAEKLQTTLDRVALQLKENGKSQVSIKQEAGGKREWAELISRNAAAQAGVEVEVKFSKSHALVKLLDNPANE